MTTSVFALLARRRAVLFATNLDEHAAAESSAVSGLADEQFFTERVQETRDSGCRPLAAHVSPGVNARPGCGRLRRPIAVDLQAHFPASRGFSRFGAALGVTEGTGLRRRSYPSLLTKRQSLCKDELRPLNCRTPPMAHRVRHVRNAANKKLCWARSQTILCTCAASVATRSGRFLNAGNSRGGAPFM